MARFPVDIETLPGLGAALAHAVDDDTARAAFIADPRTYLVDAGVDPKALEGLDLDVVEDTDTKLHFVIPANIDSGRVSRRDPDYLVDLGSSLTLTCVITPERRVVALTRPVENVETAPKASGTNG